MGTALLLLLLSSASCTGLRENGAPFRWHKRYTRAHMAHWVGDIDRAEKELRGALGDARTTDDLATRRLTMWSRMRTTRVRSEPEFTALTYEMLGLLARERGRLAESEEHYRRALALREETQKAKDLRPSLDGLARTLIAQGRLDEALEAHERAVAPLEAEIAFRRQTDGRTSEPRKALLASHSEVADEFRERSRPEPAEVLYAQAIAQRRPFPSSGDHVLARALRNHATVLEMLGREEEAADARDTAASIMDGTSYANHALAATTTRAMVARWHDDEMPIRVYLPRPPGHWVEDRERTREIAREAFLEWSGIAGDDRPRFEFVESKRSAQITVRWQDNQYGEAEAGRCFGPLNWDDRPLRRERITLTARVLGTELPERLLRMVATHEMGHALGIKGHSPVPDDIMYAYINEYMTEITARDRLTLQKLYDEEPGEYPRW